MIKYLDQSPEPEEFLALFETTGWNEKYRATVDDLSDALRGSWYVVSARDDDELVGMGRVNSDGALYAVVCDLIVAPSHRRRGIATTILDRLVGRCRKAGIRDVQLFAAKGTVDFYEKRGFKQRPGDAPGMRLVRR